MAEITLAILDEIFKAPLEDSRMHYSRRRLENINYRVIARNEATKQFIALASHAILSLCLE